MKFFVDNWLLILVAFVSGGMLVWPMVRRGGGAAAVPTSEAVRLINREKGVLIDVSEPDEFAAAHAGGARNVPFGQLEGSRDLPSNKALPVLLMCPTGARAARAAALLRKAGYARAVAVSGGLRAWREAQLPVERTESEKGADKAGDKPAGKSNKGDRGEKGGKGERPADKAATTPADKTTDRSADPSTDNAAAQAADPRAEGERAAEAAPAGAAGKSA